MKLKDLDVKAILAIFVVVFGMTAIVYVKVEDMALGALIGFISAVLGYFFGSSAGSSAKDKMLNLPKVSADDIVGDRPKDRE